MSVLETNTPFSAQYEGVLGNAFVVVNNFIVFYEKILGFSCVANKPVVRKAFETAHKCEAIYQALERTECLQRFDNVLFPWLSERFTESNSRNYNIYFFQNSCDKLLEMFLRSGQKVPDYFLNEAVLCYISVCSEERCAVLVDKLLVETQMYKSVCNVIDIVHAGSGANDEIASNVELYQRLSMLQDQNNFKSLKFWVKKRLNEGTIFSYLLFTFGRMPLMKIDPETNECLIQVLLTILLDNVDLNLKFWKVKSQCELDLLARLANGYPCFLSAMLEMVRVHGQMLELSFSDSFQPMWISPDTWLSYQDLVTLVRCLLEAQGVAGGEVKRLLLLKANKDKDNTSFWSHVVDLLNLRCHTAPCA